MTSRLSARRILFDAVTRAIPAGFATVIFTAGIALLLSIITPIDPAAMPFVEKWLPLGLVEISHAAGTVIAVLMIFLARGLWARIEAAWYAAIALFVIGAILSLTRELALINAVLLGLCALLLVPCKRAFNRRSSLLAMDLNGWWVISVLGTLGLVVWGGFYLYIHVPYAHALWVDFSYHAAAARFLRAVLVIGSTLMVFGLYRLFGIARRVPAMPDEAETEDLQAVVNQASQPQAWLALLRDKHILWNDDRTAFLMYGISGKQWVVMGEPVGAPEAALALCWQLREMASLSNARLSFYEFGPHLLPLMIDLGLRPFKVGEEAMIETANFDLAGKKGYGFRQTLKRFDTLGATFEVLQPGQFDTDMPRLKMVSDAWLAAKRGREKRYSLGSFQEAYISAMPVAVVRLQGQIMAFANLWPTHNRSTLGIDLMRYDPASPASIMEYLFLRLIVYARDSGYARFSLGLAPLAGLEVRPLSGAWHKIASVIYQLGGDIYNFEGLRAYKEKFKPVWEPRYVAVSGQETALGASLMAVVALGGKPPSQSKHRKRPAEGKSGG